MNRPLVSVVLAVYNAERFLADTIRSVLAQTYDAIQLIIVDDGSTDRTAEIAGGFSDPRVELYQLKENRHICYATNEGLSHVKGEYIAIIDGDDKWAEDKLEKQVAYLKAHPEHKACFTWVDLIDENDMVINDKMPELYDLFACSTDTQEDWLRFFFFKGNRLNNPSSLVETKAAETIGGHNVFYIQAQDMEWWVRFTKKYAFGVIEEPLTKYRRLDSDSSVSSVSEEHDSRFYNELMHIHYRFFDDMEDELFIRTFGEYFVKKDSHTPEELACEKVFLLLGGINGKTIPRALGVLKAEELLQDPKAAELMWSRYGFSTRRCGSYTGQHIYNDPILQQKIQDYGIMMEELVAKRSHCEMYVKQIEELQGALDEKESIVQLKESELQQKEEIIQMKEDGLELKESIIQQKIKDIQFKDAQMLARLADLRQKELEIQELQLQQEALRGELNQAVETIQTITTSSSWKLTAPIRKCLDKLRK